MSSLGQCDVQGLYRWTTDSRNIITRPPLPHCKRGPPFGIVVVWPLGHKVRERGAQACQRRIVFRTAVKLQAQRGRGEIVRVAAATALVATLKARSRALHRKDANVVWQVPAPVYKVCHSFEMAVFCITGRFCMHSCHR